MQHSEGILHHSWFLKKVFFPPIVSPKSVPYPFQVSFPAEGKNLIWVILLNHQYKFFQLSWWDYFIMCANPLEMGHGCHGRKVYDFVYGAFFLRREEDFVFHWDFFCARSRKSRRAERSGNEVCVSLCPLYWPTWSASRSSSSHTSEPCDVPARPQPSAPCGEREGRSE